VSDDLVARARAWIDGDPDPVTRAELQALVDANDRKELAERMAGPLVFGTAGLRGALGAGESRMNRAVVRRTTAGLAKVLLATNPEAAGRGVVIGYDARRMSEELAEEAAAVLAGHGMLAHLFPALGPTPMCAFAVLDLGAAAGIMITASHNPANDNGYKVYAADGGQIVPPVDEEIAASIAGIGPAKSVDVMELGLAVQEGIVRHVPKATMDRYFDAIVALSVDRRGRDRVRIVYTPVHGTGDAFAHEALKRFGFTQVISVAEQSAPNPAFPTAPFPNPEEKGVLDLAVALADRAGANLILANDPDADRLAVAIPRAGGGWRQLTGNEVGVLLGEYLLRHGKGGDRLVMNSIVSSPQLGGIARAHGVRFAEVLTGFKWIAATARQLERAEGLEFVFGYEEALGYTVGTVVRDKDGISAAALFAELVGVAAVDGRTVEDELERIARAHGLYASAQHNVTKQGTAGAAAIAATMDRLRASRPQDIGGVRVIAIRDVARGVVIERGVERPLDLPRSNVLVFDLDGDARIIARPSGTEPKIKFYFDVREAMAKGEPFAAANARAEARIAALKAAFVAMAGLE
jgi:phosphomannomutase